MTFLKMATAVSQRLNDLRLIMYSSASRALSRRRRKRRKLKYKEYLDNGA
jgi:hypothetical protein